MNTHDATMHIANALNSTAAQYGIPTCAIGEHSEVHYEVNGELFRIRVSKVQGTLDRAYWKNEIENRRKQVTNG
jgi:hypothetical protein